MNEFSRNEVYQSYLFLKGIFNIVNNKRFLLGIRYTGDQILAIDENGLRAILLLKQTPNNDWYFISPYPQLNPLAWHIQMAIENSSNPLLCEPAFAALKEASGFGDYSP